MQQNNIVSKVTTLTIQKGKEILYLVLKRKPFAKEIVEELEKELENRMTIFIKSIAPKLQNMNFDDPEQSLKVIILRGLINILKNMIEEHKLELSESDRKILDDIMKDEEEAMKPTKKDKDNDANQKKIKEPEDKNKKGENNTLPNKSPNDDNNIQENNEKVNDACFIQ
jgi:hypothetical protein